jgi:hypothetical protein
MLKNNRKAYFIAPLLAALLIAGCGGGGGGGGNGNPAGGNTNSTWLVPTNEIVDGGPGVDGIPALEDPQFESAATITSVEDDDLLIAVRSDGQVKAYPHDIMNWHEIVNDGPADAPFTMSYCPLTASAVAWQGNSADADKSFGVSGLLYNSNLLLYDRATDSKWSQLLQRSINGPRIGQRPETYQLIEAPFSTLKMMYPDALVMTRDTGHVRNYNQYPYGDYLQSSRLLFPVAPQDNRLHLKERLIGIHDDSNSKVYQLSEFGDTTLAINDQFANQSIVVVGNSALGFAVIFDRELADGTILSFDPIQNDLPNILLDTEGNVWDVFGTAVSGIRTGEQLQPTRSYVSMWLGWISHFDEVLVHFN